MKIRRPLFLAMVVATAVSLASIAASAVAAETPFKGTVNADETVVPSPPTASLTRDGTGTAPGRAARLGVDASVRATSLYRGHPAAGRVRVRHLAIGQAALVVRAPHSAIGRLVRVVHARRWASVARGLVVPA